MLFCTKTLTSSSRCSFQAGIARTASEILAVTDLVLLVLGILAALPAVTSGTDLLTRFPGFGRRRRGRWCWSRQVRLHLGFAKLGELGASAAPGTSRATTFGITRFIVAYLLALFDGGVLAAPWPVPSSFSSIKEKRDGISQLGIYM